jgi:hypothetical protein
MMKKQASVYSFEVRFTGKQAKAIEAAAKSKGVTPEAMVRQAVRDSLDKVNGKSGQHGLESYVLNLLTSRNRLPTGMQRQALEEQVLATLGNTKTRRTRSSAVVKPATTKVAKSAKAVKKAAPVKKAAAAKKPAAKRAPAKKK